MTFAQPLCLAGTTVSACRSGALWWQAERLLCVADLHLGKSERLARRGGALLPPYETRATLDRLAAEMASQDPRIVICLGDSFDDRATELRAEDRARLSELMAGRTWIWIAGNHDPVPMNLGGDHLDELRVDALTFRHEALPDAPPGEISGHFHPKLRLTLRGRNLSRPCFLTDSRRLILPAFGAYTGGLAPDHPALRSLFHAPVQAILTGEPCLTLPLSP